MAQGQNLGELNMWSMMNLLETSLRVPLIIKPAVADATVAKESSDNVHVHSHPVELVDLFPTLITLANATPAAPSQKLAGHDLAPAMQSGGPAKWHAAPAAYSQITRCQNCKLAYGRDAASYLRGCANDRVDENNFTVPCAQTPATHFDWMGMSVRTDDWRYTIWCKWQGTKLAADWSQCRLPELYNHTADTGLFDVQTREFFTNVAGTAETVVVQQRMHALLRAGFGGGTAD